MRGTLTHGIISAAVREVARAKGDLLLTIENPVRLGGLAALLAGVLLVISELLGSLPAGFFPFKLSGGELAIYGWLGIEGYLGVLLAVLVQLGLVGLYAPQARTAGILGLLGIFMAFIGARLIILNSFVTPFARPFVWTSEGYMLHEFWVLVAIFALSFVLGWVLFGVATLRAGLYPRAAAALLIAGAVILFLPLPLSGVIFAGAVAWMGYVLYGGRRTRRTPSEGRLLVRLENPVRWGGLAALLAGVLIVVAELVRLYVDFFDRGAYLSISGVDPWLGILLGVLVQLGLVGLYVPRANVLGVLGAVGFFIAFIGAWLTTGVSFVDAFGKPGDLPEGELEEFFGPLVRFALSFVLGWLLFGVAALRARVYPRATVALLIAGTLILLLPLPLGGVVFGVALAWIGYVLFTGIGEEALQPAHQ
jgi:hypothetical protein